MKLQARNSTDPDRKAAYLRRRDLPRLLPLWPHELELVDLAEHARLLARMRRALRLERQRGLAGHWAYDLARHAQLLRAYRSETADYMSKAKSARCAETSARRAGAIEIAGTIEIG